MARRICGNVPGKSATNSCATTKMRIALSTSRPGLRLENARRFFESPELVELRRAAGVKAPDFLYLEEIERGVL
jgi:hypothetical protein